jgi:hypothetical protein
MTATYVYDHNPIPGAEIYLGSYDSDVQLSLGPTDQNLIYSDKDYDYSVNVSAGGSAYVDLQGGGDNVVSLDAVGDAGQTIQPEGGAGQNTYVFSNGHIGDADIREFDGEATAWTANAVHDFIWFKGFSAGSTLQYDGSAGVNQSYFVADHLGSRESGDFTVSMHDGTNTHLSAASDYAFA